MPSREAAATLSRNALILRFCLRSGFGTLRPYVAPLQFTALALSIDGRL